MAINFPSNPTNAQEVTEGNVTYVYNATKGYWESSEVSSGASSGASIDVLADMAALIAKTGMSNGDQAFVTGNNNLYIYSGSGWYKIATVQNDSPSAITGVNGTYELAIDGTATTITAVSTDPEGFPLTWSYSTSGLGSIATVSQVDNVFTITPSTDDTDNGTFTLTINATDGVSGAVSTNTSIILQFRIPNSQYTSTLVEATGTGTNLTFVDASAQTHTITNTNVVAGTFSPYRGGGYSVYLDGNDYISLGNDDLTIDTEDFTIETWVNTTLGSIINLANNSKWHLGENKGWRLSITSSGTIQMRAGDGTWNTFPIIYTSTNAISSNQWSHIVICRDSGVISSYINGVKDPTTVTYSASLNQSNGANAAIAQSVIGTLIQDSNPYYPLTGYLADFHFKLGSAKYTTTFLPPIKSLTVESGTDTLLFNKPFIKDESTNAYTISLIGNPQVRPFSPYGYEEYSEAKHGSSGYFGGNVDYLSIANDASYKPIANEDYTIESWVYLTATPPAQRAQIIGIGEYGTNSDWLLAVNSDLGVTHYINPSALDLSSAAGGVKLNSWNHIAVSRSGTSTNNTKIFINGELVAQGTNNSTLVSTGSNLTLGGDANGDESVLTGYISDARIVKGTAVYTSNFTPPTEPLTAITNTTFLLNPNPNIVDKAQNSNITLVGNVTSASPPLQIFGTPNAVSFDGNDRINTSNVSAFDLSSSTTEFTIEGWLYRTGTSYNGIIGARQNGVLHGWCLYIHPNGTLYTGSLIVGNSYADRQMNTTVIPLNTWTHFALVKTTAGYKAYINGIGGSDLLLTGGLDYQSAHELAIGALGSTGEYPFTGNISNMRIVKGTAVYTSNFAPPTENLTAIANTSLLTCQGSSIVDASTNAHTFTVTGDAASVNADPYGTERVMTFDGTGDYLVASSSSSTEYGYGTGDFTIELWIYFNSMTLQTVLSNLTSGPSTNPHLYLLNDDASLKYYTGGAIRISSSALSANTWYHVALSRASGSTKLFIDGTQSGSTYTDSNNYGTTAPFVVGTYYNGGSLVTNTLFNGYIQDVRISKGLARYTSNFTPPTSSLEG